MIFRTVRGERILQALNEDATVDTLHKNIVRGFPQTTKRQHATGEVNITNLQYVPMQGKLQINSTSRSNGNNYTQVIIFSDVVNTESPDGVTFTGTDGQDHTIEPIELRDSRVKVRCNCLDFYWRFATWNFNDDALFGPKPPLYQRKTDRPPVNPANVSGVCKHLLKVTTQLQQNGVVKS
jgi:hypothetical protein